MANVKHVLIGFFGWVIAHNLFSILFSFLFYSLDRFANDLSYYVSIANIVVALILIVVLLFKKRWWIFFGVLTAVIINAICWAPIDILLDMPIHDLLTMIGLPFPLGAFLLYAA